MISRWHNKISFRRRRRGSMLHEAVIVTALSSMLFLLGIRLLHQTMNFGAEARSRIAFREIASRVASQFREDVHDATRVTFEADGTLQIENPDHSISYRLAQPEKPLLERVVVNSEGRKMRERFRLLNRSHVTFIPENSGEFVAMEISTVVPSAPVIERTEFRVVAHIGRTQHFLRNTSTIDTNSAESDQ